MVVVPAFGDVRVAASLRAAMTAARMVARLAGPLPLGETADTRVAQVAADVRLEGTGMLRRTIGAGPLALARAAVLSQATHWMERGRACGGASAARSMRI